MDNRLTSFVKEALAQGLPREEIAAALRQADWPQDDIDSSLDEFAVVDFPIPVPRRRSYGSAREAFLYLLIFLCLSISAFSFGALLFEFVDRWIPDPLQYRWNDDNPIRGFTSALIVAFPIYIWLSTVMARMMRRDPAKRESKIREWLTYVTLFVTATTIIVDLIILLTGLLQGELTLRFLLKILTVLVIAGLIFGYYLWELGQKKKKEIATNRRGLKIFVSIVSVMVAAVTVAGLLISGSPSAERARRLDEQRVNNLRSLSYAIDDHWFRHETLPATIDELGPQYEPKDIDVDPLTDRPYEYRIVDERRYELCAVFDLASEEENPTYPRYAEPMHIKVPEPGYQPPQARDWNHPAGQHCFKLEVPEKEPLLLD